MYGREPRLFCEIVDGDPVGEVSAVAEEDIEAFVRERTEADADVFNKVLVNIEKAQERQKAAYREKKDKGQALHHHSWYGGAEEK
ncbi:hypothetical protein AALO_G00224470 [Alosa alosa]|uniref:Uncharacterized protein n=1 Tax=Alosa alosa TaxID=278164 RepID=A0AAV6FY12_9TELE|nr:hypothetical protein AALO_G00224470 [Alosa alosa]